MNEKRTTPGGGRRAKRAAPTIDLSATEVQPAVTEPLQEPAQKAAREPQPEQIVETAAGQTPPPEPSPVDSRADAPDNSPNDSWTSIRRQVTAPVLAAGFAGAAAMMVLLFALWLTGLVPIRYAGSTAIRARVAALEMETQALQNRTAPAADTKAIDGVIVALTGRVNAMQDAIAKLPAGNSANDPALTERIAAADNAMKSLGVALTALNKRNDDIAGTVTQARERADAAEKAVTELRSSVQIATTATAGLSSADLDALQKRVAVLEQSTQAARDDIAKTGASDAAARLAVSAAALRDAVFSGAPYTAALAQTKALGADEKLLSPLSQFAATGVPSSQALAQELRTLLPAMIKIAGPQTAPEGGFIERLQANASKLVKVRPVDAPAGEDAASVLARADAAAAKADIPVALSELMKLAEPVRAPAQAWIAKVQARQSTANAVRSLVASTSSTLGSK